MVLAMYTTRKKGLAIQKLWSCSFIFDARLVVYSLR